ncbi:MAG: SDR family oxidoreductase [Rhodothermales bacterium]
MSATDYPTTFEEQHDSQEPGREYKMDPAPMYEGRNYKAAGKLAGKRAIITGGDSGIGRAVAVHFAKEGADVAIIYLEEDADAKTTQAAIEAQGQACYLIAADLGDEEAAKDAVSDAVEQLGGLDILVNNAAEQHMLENFENLPMEQMRRTFRSNVFSVFYVTQAALPHLNKGASIINSCSVVAFRGFPAEIDYSATKGAVVAFTRALSQQLVERGIRVNSVAPGPIWTPFITSTFPAERVDTFGQDTPMKRAGQPEELAPAYVYLACTDSSYVTGQTIHVNGGEVVGA